MVDQIFIEKSAFYQVTKNVLCCGLIYPDSLLLGPDENRVILVSLRQNNVSDASSTDASCSIVEGGVAQCHLPVAGSACSTVKMSSNRKYLCAQYQRSLCILAQMVYPTEVGAGAQSSQQQPYLQPFGNHLNTSPLDILFFEFSQSDPSLLHTIEVPTGTQRDERIVYWNTYELGGMQYIKKHSRKIDQVSSRVKLCSLSPSEKHLCLCYEDGTVVMYASFKLRSVPDASSFPSAVPVAPVVQTTNSPATPVNSTSSTHKFKQFTVNRFEGKVDPYFVKWHPSGNVIAVGFHEGEAEPLSAAHADDEVPRVPKPQCVCLLDLGLNLVRSQLENGELSDCVSSRLLTGKSSNITSFVFLDNQLLIGLEKGPMVLLKPNWDLRVLMDPSARPLSYRHLVLMHLQRQSLREAYSVIRNMSDTNEVYFCLCLLLDELLRDVTRPVAQELIDTIINKYGPVFSKSSSRTRSLFNLFRRYFAFVLRHDHVEKAFALAHALENSQLFAELYQVCLARDYRVIAYLALQHCSEAFRQRMEQLNKLPEEIEDIVKGLYGEDRRPLDQLLEHAEEVLRSKHVLRSIEQDFSYDEAERIGAHLELRGRMIDSLKFYRNTEQFRRAKTLFENVIAAEAGEQQRAAMLDLAALARNTPVPSLQIGAKKNKTLFSMTV